MPSQTPSQEISLAPIPETGIAPFLSIHSSDPSLDDMNIPIAIRKGVRFCTNILFLSLFL